MCRLNSCCFCFDTEKGSFIIAIVGIVLTVLQLISNFGSLTIVGIVTSVIGIVINILLLLGTKQKKPTFVLIWLISTIIFIILMGITLALAIIGLITGETHSEALGPIITYGLTFALEVYFWVVVYSFYRDLKDGGAGANIGMSKV